MFPEFRLFITIEYLSSKPHRCALSSVIPDILDDSLIYDLTRYINFSRLLSFNRSRVQGYRLCKLEPKFGMTSSIILQIRPKRFLCECKCNNINIRQFHGIPEMKKNSTISHQPKLNGE